MTEQEMIDLAEESAGLAAYLYYRENLCDWGAAPYDAASWTEMVRVVDDAYMKTLLERGGEVERGAVEGADPADPGAPGGDQ